MDLQEGGTRPEPLCLSTSLQVRSMTRDNVVCSKEGNSKKKNIYVGYRSKEEFNTHGKMQSKIYC